MNYNVDACPDQTMLFFSFNFGVLECCAGFYHQAALRADVEMTICSGRARGQLPGDYQATVATLFFPVDRWAVEP